MIKIVKTARELPHECQYCYQSTSNGEITKHEEICAFKENFNAPKLRSI